MPRAIRPLLLAVEANERTIDSLLENADAHNAETAIGIADVTINTLVTHITKNGYDPDEITLMAEHLVALGTIAIERSEDILVTLSHLRMEAMFDRLIRMYCEIRLTYAAEDYDPVEWVMELESLPSPEY